MIQQNEQLETEQTAQSFPHRHNRTVSQNQTVVLTIKHHIPGARQLCALNINQKKWIYPFNLPQCVHTEKCQQNLLVPQQNYKNTNDTNLRFFNQYFQNQKIVYDRWGNGITKHIQNSFYDIQKIKNLGKNQFQTIAKNVIKLSKNTECFLFDSCFESGNLSLVSRVTNNQYNLLLQNDINTIGYTNWFYFKIKPIERGIIRLNILNFKKGGRLFNKGMRILTYTHSKGWTRKSRNIAFNANVLVFQQTNRNVKNYTLSFQYQFQSTEEVYFAYNYPYTYSQLLKDLNEFQNYKFPFFHRTLLNLTLAGNRIELLTITNNNVNPHKQGIFLMARTHPGQTGSSWVLKGFLEYILGFSKQAIQLRQNFVFKIIPMINPDGVIHGNYRCSLLGKDLNRRWKNPNRQFHPEVYHVKNFILQWSKKIKILMVFDLHGHSGQRDAFIYGCGKRSNKIQCRQFPFLFSKNCPLFNYRNCNFHIQKYKESTARLVLFNKLSIDNIFTLQTSVCGNKIRHFSLEDFKKIGRDLCKTIYLYNEPSLFKQKNQILSILHQNQELIEVGNGQDHGSDSEASCDQNPAIMYRLHDSIKRDQISSSNRQPIKNNHQIKTIARQTRECPNYHDSNTTFKIIRLNRLTIENDRMQTSCKRKHISLSSQKQQNSLQAIRYPFLNDTSHNFLGKTSKQQRFEKYIENQRKNQSNQTKVFKIRQLGRAAFHSELLDS